MPRYPKKVREALRRMGEEQYNLVVKAMMELNPDINKPLKIEYEKLGGPAEENANDKEKANENNAHS